MRSVTAFSPSPLQSSPLGVDSPSEMEVTEVNDNSVTVNWSPAQGPIKGYRVTAAPRNGQGASFTEVVAPGILSDQESQKMWCSLSILKHDLLSILNTSFLPTHFLFFLLISRPDRVYFLWPHAYSRVHCECIHSWTRWRELPTGGECFNK